MYERRLTYTGMRRVCAHTTKHIHILIDYMHIYTLAHIHKRVHGYTYIYIYICLHAFEALECSCIDLRLSIIES